MSWLSEALGGGGDDSASREMIDLQKEEARIARQKDTDRTARINAGLKRIKETFHGRPVLAPKTFDWKTFNPATTKAGAVPGMAGYTFVDLPAIAAIAGTAAVPESRRLVETPSSEGGTRQSWQTTPGKPAVAAVPGRAKGIYIKGPDGKIYKQGDVVTGQVPTGKTTGGLQSDFYNNFRQGMLDFYTPQVAEKYQDAKNETTYRFADAGTLRSSMANVEAGNLFKQNLLNLADVRSKADTATAGLRTNAFNEEQKANAQLYATENPDVAANAATTAVTNITAEKPSTTPLGDIFNIAAVGGAKFLQGADNAAFAKRVGALSKDRSTIVGG